MNDAQLHLVFTHLPIIGLGFGILLILLPSSEKAKNFQKLTLWYYLLFGFLLYLHTSQG